MIFKEPKTQEDVRLQVGDGIRISTGPASGIDIVYAGMSAPEVFSLAESIQTSGYHAWAYNLYFPVSQTEIDVGKRRLQVQKVTPEEILLKYVK
jgi:hypothetical protein